MGEMEIKISAEKLPTVETSTLRGLGTLSSLIIHERCYAAFLPCRVDREEFNKYKTEAI